MFTIWEKSVWSVLRTLLPINTFYWCWTNVKPFHCLVFYRTCCVLSLDHNNYWAGGTLGSGETSQLPSPFSVCSELIVKPCITVCPNQIFWPSVSRSAISTAEAFLVPLRIQFVHSGFFGKRDMVIIIAYSHLSNKRACPFIYQKNLRPCSLLLSPASLLNFQILYSLPDY